MQHDLSVDGFGFRLRPVRIEDAAFIVQLRSDKDRARFLHPISPRIEDQEAWIRQYLAREGDYYFIVKDGHSGRAEGTISVYDIPADKRSGEVGRWIIRPGSAASYASLFLAWQVAFEVLGLDMFYTRTLAKNMRVNVFLRCFKLEDCGMIPDKANLGGVLYDMVEYRMRRAVWLERKNRLQARVNALTRLLRQSETCGQGNYRRHTNEP